MAYYGETYDPTDRGESLCHCGKVDCRKDHPYRIQVTSGYVLVADETFASLPAKEAFWTWFANQPDLPAVGAIGGRADLADLFDISPRIQEALIPGIRDRFIGANYRHVRKGV